MKCHLFGMCQKVYHVYKLVVISGNKCIILVQDNLQYFCYKYLLMEETQLPESEQVLAAASANQPFAAEAPKKSKRFKKFMRRFLLLLILGLGIFIYFKYFYVFGDGVKSGHLNYAVKKGNIFKTYEGKLIQEGYRSKTAGTIQSYEFEFSINSKKIYEILSANSGKRFDLHYKEYHGVVPWRGNTKYVVDSIISMKDE